LTDDEQGFSEFEKKKKHYFFIVTKIRKNWRTL